MDVTTSLVKKAQEYVSNLFTYHLSKKHHFHNLNHTKNVVRAVGIISDHLELDSNDQEVLLLAAWFHDTGFLSRPMDNERIGVLIAENYLRTNELPHELMGKVRGCILATKEDARAKNILEAIIQDADMFHLSQDNYWAQNSMLRNELRQTCELNYTDKQWYKINLDFLKNKSFKTSYGQKFLEQSRNTLIYENKTILKSISGTEKEIVSPTASFFPSMGTKEVIVLESGCKIAI
jgi:predicted metal-dependent HD superfamily phosphohydrolase